MNIQARVLVVLIAISSMVAIFGFFITYQIGKISEHSGASAALANSLTERFEILDHTSRLDRLAFAIKYYDEVLTQSARNYALTSDVSWKERYRASEPELDAVIKEAISEGGIVEVFFASINDANHALIRMEHDSIALVDDGKPLEAIQILDSKAYHENKVIYNEALERYIASRGDEYEIRSNEVADAVMISNKLAERSFELSSQLNRILPVAVLGLTAVVAIVGLKLSRSIIRPINNLISATDELAKGNYEARLGGIGKDETGLLASRFDQMRKELKERDCNKNEFIKIASHELRTPIQPILGYVELARKNIVDKDKALFEIEIQAKRLSRLATDLLNVAKSDSGELTYKMERVKVNELLKSAVKAANASLDGNNKIKIHTDILSTDGLSITADPARLLQVLANIVNNAIKFTKEGTIKISTKRDDSANEVLLEIQDSGRGISKEIIPRLFTRFGSTSSVDCTTEGTGLGLYLAARILEAHNGRICGRNNKESNGATFEIALPYMIKDMEKNSDAALIHT